MLERELTAAEVKFMLDQRFNNVKQENGLSAVPTWQFRISAGDHMFFMIYNKSRKEYEVMYVVGANTPTTICRVSTFDRAAEEIVYHIHKTCDTLYNMIQDNVNE